MLHRLRKLITPRGWRLVPISPTVEMIQAGGASNRGGVLAMWRRMVEAAPKP